jgi:ABC-type branched-subunit amino acid transport system substrate-binding protein
LARPSRAAAALAALIAIGGCGLGTGPADVEGPVTVYVSLPLSGREASDGRDATDGARLALAEADGKAGNLDVVARFLDDAAADPEVELARVGANARRATSDSSTAAYIGELESGPTRTSLPILNDAGIAQVSPGATAVDLTGPAPGFEDAPDRYRPSGKVSFARVIPSDLVVTQAAKRSGELVEPALAITSLPPTGRAFVARFRQRFGRLPGPYGAYGYEAMAVILDAIEQRDTSAQDFRSSVVESVLKVTRGEESVLGPYSFTTDGDTTLCEVQPYREAGSGPVPLHPICGAP